MTLPRFQVMPRLMAAVFASLTLAAFPAAARDVYKGFLDPAIPQHRAILDTLERLKASPKDAGLHNDLGCLIARDGFWRDALREFDTAADLDRKDAHPFFNAGLVYAYKGEWRGARRKFAAASRRDPGNWPAWWMLGFAEERLGNTEAAVEAYKVSVRFDTSLFEVAHNAFAAETGLKSRVLLDTYAKRRIRAAMPEHEQFEDPDRVASFFQHSRVTVTATSAPPAAPIEEVPVPRSGPVVTSVPPSSGGASTSTKSGPPAKPGPPTFSRPTPRAARVSASPTTPAPSAEDFGRAQAAPAPIPGVPESAPPPPNPEPTKRAPGPGGPGD
jgi:hypothetical protein